MYAIVEIAGQQFKVEEGKKIFVHRLKGVKDSILEFDRVLLFEDNDKILIGEPAIENYVVEGKVLEHVKGDKVIVFKKKRKKGYRVTNGHRQNFSQIEIIGIGEKGTIKRKESPRKEKVKKAPEHVEEPVTEPVAEKKTREKKPAAGKQAVKEDKKVTTVPKAKKTTEKKVAEKKPAAKKVSKKKE